MSELIEIERLTKAIANVASVLSQTVAIEIQKNLPARAGEQPAHFASTTPGWMGKKELAAHLGVSVRTIDNLVARRQVPFVRLSQRCLRFPPSVVDEELKRKWGVGTW
jgi:hypothetical protein